MTKLVAVICVRMTSSRLPGKALCVYDPAGKTNLECIIERVRTSRYNPDIVIATSIDPSDDPIQEFHTKHSSKTNPLYLVRGSLENVTQRFHQGVLAYAENAEYIWRVMADNPLIDIGLVDHRIDTLIRYDADVVVPILPEPTYAAQSNIWSRAAWEYCAQMSSGSLLEHPGEFIYENESQFKTIRDPGPSWEYYQNIRTELDASEDLEFFKTVWGIWGHLGCKASDVLSFLSIRPDIVALNSHVQMKTSTTYGHGHHRARNIRCQNPDCGHIIAHKVNERVDIVCAKCGTTKQFYM